MIVEFDLVADRAYVRLVEGAYIVSMQRLGEQRVADYDLDGELVGIEFLRLSNGVNLEGLPEDLSDDTLLALYRLAGICSWSRSLRAYK